MFVARHCAHLKLATPVQPGRAWCGFTGLWGHKSRGKRREEPHFLDLFLGLGLGQVFLSGEKLNIKRLIHFDIRVLQMLLAPRGLELTTGFVKHGKTANVTITHRNRKNQYGSHTCI